MPLSLAWATLSLVLAAVLLGGLVKGVAGFGYAVTSTALLAMLLDPAAAVTVMILPTLVANVPLLAELERDKLRSCVRRFWPFVAAALVGTLAGMAVLDRVPKAYLALGLGLVTFAYVLSAQPYRELPGSGSLATRLFRPSTATKLWMGLASGLVFGASNIAVQIVAYLDRLDLDRATFVGVLAMILVGVSTVRVGAAWTLGLYGTGSLLALSGVAVVPGLVGVFAGGRLRPSIPEGVQTGATLGLLVVIAARLTTAGLGGL
ncbi:MAG: sulfite exporter TauE/SafE family protein [Halobacteriales archaeon]|nr:sulfite exporter TauE/SafE family protein [Halobacteriales archaeon]